MLKYEICIPLTGADRNEIAEKVAKFLNVDLIYESQVYFANKWQIYRDKTLKSPHLTLENLSDVQNLLASLAESGLSAAD
jgi:hypothetical protein